MKLYQNKDWLYQKYWVEKLSLSGTASLCGISNVTIRNWMKKHRIKTRTFSEAGKIAQNHPGMKKKQSEMWKIILARPGMKKKAYEALKIAMKCPEVKKTLQGIMRKRWAEPNDREKMIEAMKISQGRPEARKMKQERLRKLWANPEYRNKVLKANKKWPTKPEKTFNEITPACIRYVGNSAWWRKLNDGKHHNPDFKVTGQNKVIEIFGDYWHRNDDPQKLIDLYAKAGLECLVFWEREVYENPEQVKEKAIIFSKA